MTLYQLTFRLSRDAICPGCNAFILSGCWTIRQGLALCMKCADVLPLAVTQHMSEIQRQHGAADWSVHHEVSFLTPRIQFNKDRIWHLWVIEENARLAIRDHSNVTPDRSA